MKYGVYRVTGRRQYRGHHPGTTFEAVIDPAVADRAINRGDIKLLRYIIPDLEPDSFQLGAWPPAVEAGSITTTDSARNGPDSTEGGDGK